MVKHYNADIAQDAARIFKTKGDPISDDVQGIIANVPIEAVNDIVRQASAAGAILAVQADSDFILTGVSLATSKSAALDGTLAYVEATINGVARVILILAQQTLTAESHHEVITFPKGIKIDGGTNINLAQSGTFSVIQAVIYGYYRRRS